MNQKTPKSALIPPNLEAEIGVLAIIMADNASLPMVSDRLQSDKFGEPFHQAVFEAIAAVVSDGFTANPVTIRSRVETHPSYADVGQDYLDRLFKASLPATELNGYVAAILENYARRSILSLSENLNAAALNGADSLASLVGQAASQVEKIEESLNSATARKVRYSFDEMLTEAIDRTAQAYQYDGQHPNAVPTGIKALDDHLGGLIRGELTIIGGRPGMAKTTLAQHCAYHAAKAGKSSLFFSLEMTAAALGIRQISMAMHEPKVPYSRIAKGRISEAEWNHIIDAARAIRDFRMTVVDAGRINIAKIDAEISRAKAQDESLAVAVVDYLQLVHGVSTRETRAEEIGKMTASLKTIAKRYDVAMVVLSQIGRGVEQRDNKRPQLSDLKESGSIEEHADVIIFPFREEYYLAREEPKPNTEEHLAWQDKIAAASGIMELIIAKFKMGSTMTLRVKADMPTNSIYDMDDSQGEMF